MASAQPETASFTRRLQGTPSRCQKDDAADLVTNGLGQAVDGKGHHIGPHGVSDQDGLRVMPMVQVIAKDPIQVRANSSGVRGVQKYFSEFRPATPMSTGNV